MQSKINSIIDRFLTENETNHLRLELLNSFAERSVKRSIKLKIEGELDDKLLISNFESGIREMYALAQQIEESLLDWYQAAIASLESEIAIHKTAIFTHLKRVNELLNGDVNNSMYQTKTIQVLYKFFTEYSSERIANELTCEQFISALSFRIVSAFSEDVN